ncbi:MAG: DUF4965 domain-containing protein [Cytophagales bacterium]|nr:MAG: DUF4965 domain-containing protein [Cytophagales bacterium]
MTTLQGLSQPTIDRAKTTPKPSLNPPAIPLITIDPYTSIWSFGGKLNGDPTRHWTGRAHALNGLIRVDGRVFRFMGKPTFTGDTLVPSGLKQAYKARYTTEKPADNWASPDFDDSQWATGESPFGSRETDRTRWNTHDIWVRRVVDMPSIPEGRLLISAIYNDNYELFVNGQRVAGVAGVSPNYELTATKRPLAEVLKPGRNVLAFHSQNFSGPGFVDLGLLAEREVNQPLAEQTSARMTATQSVFTFGAGGVELTVTFMAPLLMNNLDVLSRPVQYITYSVRATDGKPHKIELYSDASSDLAVDSPDQPVVWRRGRTEKVGPKLNWMRVGTAAQKVLGRKGDNVRIDWGHLYVATVADEKTGQRIGPMTGALNQFEREGRVTDLRDEGRPTIALQNPTVLATTFDLGTVTDRAVERHWLLGYDDVKAVEYFGQPLRAWWRRYEKDTDAPEAAIERALQAAETDYIGLRAQCNTFDNQLYADARQAGGSSYADLCVLAYRQAIAAHKLVARPDGTPLFFSKENFSNGSIGTVDVTYPSAPLFLLYNPTLLKGMMEPIFDYSESGRWTKPFAAHDVGTYPLANGQTYGEDMPVEECGNMLILTAAIAAVEGNANYAKKHWPVLTTWTNYLKEHGFDPENQLCTDDFAGHLARNANLSVKAIMGIASYGYLANLLGDRKAGDEHLKLARELAKKWMVLADKGDRGDGPHYALTFNQNDGNTWSQKYNLIWDKLLKLDRNGQPIFPREVAQREVAYYLTKQLPYGLPLDSRRTYSKSDWIIWTATLADRPSQFDAFIEPVLKFANESPDRIPLSDWHETTNGKHVGFRARSVVGGYFIKMLEKKLK